MTLHLGFYSEKKKKRESTYIKLLVVVSSKN